MKRRGLYNLVSRWDVHPVNRRMERYGEKSISDFFFSEIPDNNKAADVFGLFGFIGKIVEVVISPRRNKYGKRSGFARFSKVEDLKLLAIKLDNVTIYGKQIHANPPRFERGGGKEGFNSKGGFRKNIDIHQKSFH